ncbi:unnamed protein product [Merluccius merluccius]
MMKKKATKSLAVAVLLLASAAHCILLPTNDDLTQMSQLGEKYLDKQIENAINGVKEMKTIMDKSSDDHKTFLSTLEETKLKKEDALRKAQDVQAKLEQEEEVCNETMRALWEECKPCLKNTCVKYYSRTCSSGAGLVGRQLETVLNRTSPFSIWINGENLDVLEKEDERQNRRFQNLEDRYSEVEDGVHGIFSDSMKVFDHMRSLDPPLFPFRMPSLWGQQGRRSQADLQGGVSRMVRSPLQDPGFHGFQSMFFPMMDARDLFINMGSMVDRDGDMEAPTSEDGSVNEDVVITKPFGNGQMTCREIRRNSAGCIKLREECQKCKDIRDLDCSGKKPLEGPLKAELEEALALAERFTQRYSALLRSIEEQMFNTSAILDFLNQQFSWVSTLANNTDTNNPIFQVQTVISNEKQEKAGEGEKNPSQTKVSVHLFEGPPMTLTVPEDIPWSDPKFPEVVAQKALDRYKEGAV